MTQEKGQILTQDELYIYKDQTNKCMQKNVIDILWSIEKRKSPPEKREVSSLCIEQP